ncbi:MAG: FtsX-like permease family protein, partial [Acidimicrobiia bacterium]
SATLWSLGVRRRQLVAMTIIRAAFIGLVAMAMAVVVAFFLSVLTPIGLARDLEPSPGLHADAVTLGVGAVLTVVLTLALIAVPAWLIARSVGSGARRRSLVRPSRVAATVSRAGGSIPAIVGVRMALERDRGREAVPVRTGVLGVVVGVVVLCAAVGFSASLHHLLESPRLIGYTWDAIVFVGEEDSLDVDAVAAEIEMISGVAGTTPGVFVFGPFFTDRPLLLGSHRRAVDLLVIGPGRVHPAVIDGRAPIGADEILLGPETLQEVGLEVGDTLTAFGQVGPDIRVEGEKSIVLNEPDVGKGTSARFRIVGSGVPPFGAGAGGADPRTESRLGRGAVMTVAGLQRLNPVARPNALYVRFTDRADRSSALAALRREARAGGIGEVSSDSVSTEEALDVEQIDEFPLVLAGLVAFVAACVLAHLLVTSTRARRRDFAVLRALGFRRRQVRGVITWQAVTIVAIALVVGMPLGVVLGRWGWQLYAGTINVVPEAAVSGLALVMTAIGAIAVANLVAALPARTAAHTRPAVVLRSE